MVVHVKVGKTKVDVAVEASIFAVEAPVDHFWNELTRQCDDESVGDYGDSSERLHNVQPHPNTLHFLSYWSPV